MTLWLLNEDTARELFARRQRAELHPGQREAFVAHQAAQAAAHDRRPRNLSVAGETAEIRVEGILVEQMDFWLWLFGYAQTPYADIQTAIEMVQGDDAVTDVRVIVDSPGGTVDGLFETLDAFKALRADSRRTVQVLAANAFSAAYGIASVAGPIEATNRAAGFGSVGVAASYAIDDAVIDLTNTESPDKRPDVSTPAGQAVVRKYLDSVFELFATEIANGRSTTRDDVAENFGRGALLVAEEAQRRGMIDSVAGSGSATTAAPPAPAAAAPAAPCAQPRSTAAPARRAVSLSAPVTPAAATTYPGASSAPSTAGPAPAGETMSLDLRTLRADHPDLYDAVLQEGVTQERGRVCAHLNLGASSGSLETAHTAIREGTEMTTEMQSVYMAAGMDRARQQARQADSDAAGDVVDGAAVTTPDSGDMGDQVAALMRSKRGKKD